MRSAQHRCVSKPTRSPTVFAPGLVLAASALLALLLQTQPAQAQSFRLPEPSPAATSRTPITLSDSDREHYLSDWRRSARPTVTLALLRSSLGGQAFYSEGQEIGGSFATGLEGGARALVVPGSESGLAFLPLVAARFTAGDYASQTFSVGLGLSYEGVYYSLTATGRAVAGWFEGAEALGFDYGGQIEIANLVGLEVDHQVLYVDGRAAPMHGLRVLFTIDVGPLLHSANGSNYYEDR